MPAMYREPLCPIKVLPLWEEHLLLLRPTLLGPLRSYGLMRPTKFLSDSMPMARSRQSLQVGASPCWKMAVPDVISVGPSLDA